MEIGSFYLTEKTTRNGLVIYELKPIHKELDFNSSLQFTSQEEAIIFAKKLSKRYKRFLQKLNL